MKKLITSLYLSLMMSLGAIAGVFYNTVDQELNTTNDIYITNKASVVTCLVGIRYTCLANYSDTVTVYSIRGKLYTNLVGTIAFAPYSSGNLVVSNLFYASIGEVYKISGWDNMAYTTNAAFIALDLESEE